MVKGFRLHIFISFLLLYVHLFFWGDYFMVLKGAYFQPQVTEIVLSTYICQTSLFAPPDKNIFQFKTFFFFPELRLKCWRMSN